jgi:NADPH-dependent ferric siderophore reductase
MAEGTDLPMQVYRAVVVRTERLTPSMMRVVLGGEGLRGYRSTGVGDEYIRVIFPADGSTEPVLPTVTDGNLDYGSIDMETLRTYTVRDFDADRAEVTVDFVIHEGGVAAEWAQRAAPGDIVGVNTPCGLYDPPDGIRWQVLVADCAGVPAAARILQTTPSDVATRLVLEVPDRDHHLDLPTHPRAEVTWVYGGNGHGPSRLEEVVRTLPRPDGVDGYVWVAGESRVLRGIRRYLRHELGLPATAYKSIGYWIENAEQWRERYDALDDETREALESMWDSDADPEEIEDRYDERLSTLGL